MDNTTATKLTLIAKKAKEDTKFRFRSLIHHLNPDYLLQCYAMLKNGKAPGIDGRVRESYSKQEITQTIQEVVTLYLNRN